MIQCVFFKKSDNPKFQLKTFFWIYYITKNSKMHEDPINTWTFYNLDSVKNEENYIQLSCACSLTNINEFFAIKIFRVPAGTYVSRTKLHVYNPWKSVVHNIVHGHSLLWIIIIHPEYIDSRYNLFKSHVQLILANRVIWNIFFLEYTCTHLEKPMR